jgi:hypothetical protein
LYEKLLQNLVANLAGNLCIKSCCTLTPVGRIWRWEALDEEKVGWCFSTWIVEILYYNAFPFLVVDH